MIQSKATLTISRERLLSPMSTVLSDEISTGMRLLGVTRIADLKPELLEIMPGLLGEIVNTQERQQLGGFRKSGQETSKQLSH
jgi:hypothetical protein